MKSTISILFSLFFCFMNKIPIAYFSGINTLIRLKKWQFKEQLRRFQTNELTVLTKIRTEKVQGIWETPNQSMRYFSAAVWYHSGPICPAQYPQMFLQESLQMTLNTSSKTPNEGVFWLSQRTCSTWRQEALQSPSWPACRRHLTARNQEASVTVATGSVLALLKPSNLLYPEPTWAVFMLVNNFNSSFNFFFLKIILCNLLRSKPNLEQKT